MAFWPELAARAVIIPLLIHLRRSPELDKVITEAVALVELGFNRWPRRRPASLKSAGTAFRPASPGALL
jgi:hypothetical protein